MNHTMQEMSPAELEATIGGVGFWEGFFAAIGRLIDTGIALVKGAISDARQAVEEWRKLYG